ncbi:MAG TPA: tetraacyldisaccharide 4'-kinase [Pirellulales bacterium]|nr:tetraacyldisaccharide 4'-kinase [Pirellulales bacterium]
MLSPADFRAVVSGQRRDVSAFLWRALFRVVEVPYTIAVRYRNHGYDRQVGVQHASVPVISVGNLTLGGTGKTPLVAWIARWMRARDVRVTLISRGYGAQQGARNDEALELEQKLPDVPHLQNPDRVAAAHTAVEEFECQLILLDDGFQHRRLARDLDIVLVDALEPFGFDHVFPRGMLREPVSSLRRADCVALSRADMVSPERRAQLRAIVARYNPQAVWLEMRHAPERLLAASGKTGSFADLAGQKIAPFCGIGNPAGFRHTLAQCGLAADNLREFRDHHAYTQDDVQSLGRWAREQNAAALVCTHKDLVKLGVDQIGGIPLWAVEIGVEMLAGEAALDERLQTIVAKVATS